MTEAEEEPRRSLFWPLGPVPMSEKRGGSGEDVSAGAGEVSVNVLYSGEPGQGRQDRLGGPRILRFFSGRSIRQRLSRKGGCPGPGLQPQEARPEEEKLQTSEGGETPDQALGMA